MSKIGKKLVEIPEDVSVSLANGDLSIKGPAGELRHQVPSELKVRIKDQFIILSPRDASRQARQLWGLTRTLINNAVLGVKKPFRKELELKGIGYRVEKKGSQLVFHLGFSTPIEFTPPAGISLEVTDKNRLVVSGVNKQLVGQVAAQIRGLRPPEPYKGKGLRYVDEVVRKKPGKVGKAGTGLGGEGS